jgi:RNA polymerase sigma-70 factor (ECF subfamily)
MGDLEAEVRLGESRAPEASDERLVAAARDGDVRAFETLLDRHQGKVLRVLRLMGVPSRDREDVAQEVFIRVFRHLDGFKAGHPFAGWLYRVTVNASYDYHLRTGRQARDEVPWSDGVGERAAHDGPGPEREAEGRSLRDRLEAALGALSERERAVFVLKELEGQETPDVARALGITRITVRRHLGRARVRLRLLLGSSERGRRP